MSLGAMGSSASTLTMGSLLFVSEHVLEQASQSLTDVASMRVWMKEGILPLLEVHSLQNTFPHNLQ